MVGGLCACAGEGAEADVRKEVRSALRGFRQVAPSMICHAHWKPMGIKVVKRQFLFDQW